MNKQKLYVRYRKTTWELQKDKNLLNWLELKKKTGNFVRIDGKLE